MLFLLALATSCVVLPAQGEAVAFETQDGVQVHGTLTRVAAPAAIPAAAATTEPARAPAVLLLHGGRQDRSEWDGLLPALQARGWTTLAIDLRGHGETGGEIEDWSAFFNDANGVPHDVEAALAFLREDAGVDPERIAVVGSSVGANLACVAVQKFGARGAVFFSGKTEAAASLAGEELTRLHSTLYVAAADEQGGARAGWARALAEQSAEPARAYVVGDSSTHGAALLAEDPSLTGQVVGFLGGVLGGDRFDTIELQAADGLTVTADLYQPHPIEAPLLVLCHQANWSRGEYRESAPMFATLGFNCLALDQRSGKETQGVVNLTAAAAKELGLAGEYLDAEPDILAGLKWAKSDPARGPVVLVGSSYSASLALRIAGLHGDLVDGVMAFSPGEYFRSEGASFVQEAASAIECPSFITAAQGEAEAWAAIYAAIPGAEGQDKWGVVPATASQHGSRALWAEFDDSGEVWGPVEEFLLRWSR